mmetsp:Transcript_21317/g.54243  ORF Transcript_21317/g.54243 Transcript_21317/m.54243 type:complete len:234 (-) Transcript_21317:1335-2036(-)
MRVAGLARGLLREAKSEELTSDASSTEKTDSSHSSLPVTPPAGAVTAAPDCDSERCCGGPCSAAKNGDCMVRPTAAVAPVTAVTAVTAGCDTSSGVERPEPGGGVWDQLSLGSPCRPWLLPVGCGSCCGCWCWPTAACSTSCRERVEVEGPAPSSPSSPSSQPSRLSRPGGGAEPEDTRRRVGCGAVTGTMRYATAAGSDMKDSVRVMSVSYEVVCDTASASQPAVTSSIEDM